MEAQESWSSSGSSSGDLPTPRTKRDSKIIILPKEERLEVLSEAAELGRLTRLNEHVVEAVAGPREEEYDVIESSNNNNSHHPPTNSIVATSNFQIAIQEAAEQGKLRRLKPVVIENFREREEQPDHVMSISHFKDDTRISKFLEQERQRKHIETPMERAERIQEAMDKVQTLSPKAIQTPTVKANIPLRMREDVAKKAANLSKDRFHRIQNEENELKVTLQCQCPHCKNASPFQTNFYKSLQKEQLQRIKSQRAVNRLSQQKLKVEPTMMGIAEEDEEEEEEDEEEVDEKLLKLRKQVEASILEDERRRQKEEADQKKANQHANIQAAKAILEKTLFQPKAPKQDITTVESIDPDVLYSNTFGKAFAQVSRRIIKEYEMNEEEWNQKEIDEQMEQEDLRQLTELYDRQDNGEKVDEERIYELELFDRARRDAYLSAREQKDLAIYTKRRKRTDRFIEEYEDVMSRLNEGEEIDEHHAYQLEYVVKKRGLSQDLTMAEESAMIQFETEEYLKDGLNPEDFKTSFGLESSDEEDDDDENDSQSHEEENVSLHSKASRQSSAADSKREDVSSIQKKPSEEDAPGAVESSDSDSSDSSSHGSLSEDDDSEDSSLSYYEKDELQDLTEYKESGEEIDMNRYMDLYLFDKWKRGEKLNQKEQEHLAAYRRRRRMERNYRIEFSELVQLQATGQPHDEERFYHLQLFARRQVGQPLNHDETRELEWFVEEEERKEEERLEERRRQRKAKKGAKGKNSDDDDSSKSASSHATGDEESAKSQHSNGSDEDNHIVVDSGPSIFDHVSRQSHIMDQEAKAKQKYAKSSKPKLDDVSDDGIDSSSEEEDSMDRSRSDGSSHEASDRDPPAQRDEPEVSHIESKDQGEDHSNSMDGSQSGRSDHEADDDQAIKRDELETARGEPNYQGGDPINSMHGSLSDGSGHEATDSQSSKGDDPEASRIEQKDQGEGPSKDKENDESSFLSPDEFSEYLGLVEAKDKGLDVDDDRLQLLRLINMWQFGESMSVEQEFKLDGFRRKRRKARKLKQEFADLLERSDKGEEVDEDRLYLLELFARKQIGEHLTEDEALDLKEMEEKEGLTDEEGGLPHPSAAEVTKRDRSEQVLYSVVISDNESLPSAGEVEELEELLEREANREEIDDKRLYALQLLMKWQNGDGLDTIQRNDLASLRYQRRRDRHYKNEFEDLLLKGDEGIPVDENRIYFLQLYARRLLGEPLSYDEVVDLERFEGEETISFEKEEQIVPISNPDARGDEISGAPVAAPVLEQPPQVDGKSNQLVPDPWSTDTPGGDTADDEETKEPKKINRETVDVDDARETEEQGNNDDDASSEPPPRDGSEGSGSDSIEDRTDSPRMDPPSDDNVEPYSKSSDTPLESTSNPNDEEARKTPEVQPSEGETPRAISRDFATLHTVPESSISPEGKSADFEALKKTDESTNEKPLTRQHDASVATTVPITEESSQNELQSAGERSAFPSSVIEVIHESMSQEGRSTLDGHIPRSEWKDKEPEIPEPIMAAMEANANLLKELDAARLATHEARERAGQEAARRAAAEDNAKYAETEAFRAKVALATADQQRRNYAEPMYQMSRNIHASDGSHEKSSNVPESYLSVMAFNTKLLEQLNDTRQAALEATEQANQEAAKRAAAEENAKKAATDVMFARNALASAAQQRELRSNQAKENSELMKPYIAAMEANAKLLEQLDAARKEALQAKSRATEEALKRSTAEENAKRAAMEAEKATVLLLQREGEIPNDLVSDPWSVDQQFNLDVAGLPSDVPNPLSLVDIPFVANVDPEKRAQQRRERAMKAIEERRRRDAEQAVARTEAEELEKEHREQVRVAVEERKRKTRAAMEARKKQTIERAMQGMALYTMDSTGDEALQAAKRAKELLQSRRARLPAPSGHYSTENSIKPTPSSDLVDPLKDSNNQENSTKPISKADSLEYLKNRLEAGDQNDPPAQASSDPPGTQATRRKKSGAERHIQRDPSSSRGEAVRSDAFIGQVVATDPSEHNTDADKDEVTHEDWYSKMEKIAMSHTTEHGQDDAPKEGSNMSPEDWYQEIEALSRDSPGEASSNADSDMKRAIEEAQRKAAATNMETEDDVEKEVSEDVEAIRRKVMKMSKDEAVNQILRQASIDVKSTPRQDSRYGRASAFDPELEASTGEDPAYTIGAASEVSSVSGGGGYELRSQQASYQKPDGINKSYRSLQSRNSRRSTPRRKEKGQIPRAPEPAKKPVATRPRPTPMKNISWRSNPKDNFSDWRVEITHKETGKVDVYHVHRNILGYGARKSEYFAAQFQGDRVVSRYSDTATPKKTKLDLPQAWAEMFPMVLDFLYYNREQTLKLTAHRSCAMYRWAEFLGIPALKSTIVDFYNKNLTLKNFGRFVASAVQMKAGPLVVASKSKIGKLVTQQPNQAWRLAPQFLLTILEANRKELITKAKNKQVDSQAFQISSCKWSKAIYFCVSRNKKDVTPKVFADLTSETCIPVIDSTVALPLLILDVELRQDKQTDSKFQKRCVQSIVKNWDSFRLKYPNQKALTNALQKLPSDVLTEILILSNHQSKQTKSNPHTAI